MSEFLLDEEKRKKEEKKKRKKEEKKKMKKEEKRRRKKEKEENKFDGTKQSFCKQVSGNSYKRISKEYRKVLESDIADIIMLHDNMDTFQIKFTPEGGHYEGQTVIIEIKPKHPSYSLPYPYNPPQIKMITHIWHMNISTTGSICVDFLTDRNSWVATYSFESIISAIKLLFDEPNPDSPYNSDAAQLYRESVKLNSFLGYDKRIKNYYKEHIIHNNKVIETFQDIYKNQQLS